MKTLDQHIASLRLILKKYTDDTLYNDKSLYDLLNDARCFFVEREADNWQRVSNSYYLTICLELELKDYHNCNCVPIEQDCKVLKSKNTIPGIVFGRNMPLATVQMLSGEKLDYVTPDQRIKNKHSIVKHSKPGWFIENDKLIIWNVPNLKVIEVRAIWENPIEIAQQGFCFTDNNPCYDPKEDNFPMELSKSFAAYEFIIQKLGLGILKDKTNNSLAETE